MALLRSLCSPSSMKMWSEQRCKTSLTMQNSCQTKLPCSSLLFCTPAISFVSGILSNNRTTKSLVVLHFSSEAQQQSSSSTATTEGQEIDSGEGIVKTRLIAQNVPWTCTAEDIRPLFEKHGTVIDIELSMHNKTRNRGLAFITMGTEEEALSALNNLESYELEGRALKIAYAKTLKKKRSATQPETVQKHYVFVGNLSWKVKSRDLREFFGSGSFKVVSAEVKYNSNPRKSTGYGFVSFSSKEEAESTISAFNGKELMGRPIRLSFGKLYLKRASKEGIETEDSSSEINSDESLPENAGMV